jgi:xanthine dehydrogenase YagR molybdenum-binding subunit
MSEQMVGRPLDRVDGPDKVTGKARYAAEFQLPGLVNAVVVRSTIAHGTIRKFDLSAAKRAVGVLAIYTYENFPKLSVPKDATGKPGEKTLPMQSPAVSYDGQIVAMVVAETFEQAVYAGELIKIHYAAEKPALSMQAAAHTAYEPAATHGRKLREDRGELRGALRTPGLTIHEATYTTPIEHHNPIEAPASVASWKNGKLTLYTATQSVVGSQDLVGKVFGLEKDDVHVLSPFLGGGFGCKGFVWAHPILAAVASKKLGRPVKLVQTREQMFTLNGHRSQTSQKITVGADAQGKFQAMSHLTTSVTSKVGEFVESCGLATMMLYNVPNLLVTHSLIPLNLNTPCPMRAPGEAPGLFALESAIDELADKLGIDPLELRLRNYAEVDPSSHLPFSGKHLRECYAKGAEAFGWLRRNPKPGMTRSGRWLIGQGMATSTYPGNRSSSSARARITVDGRAHVGSCTQDIGTGTYTVMTQVAADALGLTPDQIHFKLGDTTLPPGANSGGSQTAASVGPAVREACLGLRSKFLELVARDSSPLSGKTSDQVEASNGRLFVLANPEQSESYVDILKRHGLDHLEAEATTVTQTDVQKGKQPSPAEQEAPSSDQDKKKFSFHSFGAMFCEVGVDPDLGTVRIRRFVTALDVGRVLNQKTARSQAMGAIIYGIGMGLFEQTALDPHTGRYMTHNLADYLVPVNADIPLIEVHFVEQPDLKMNVLGSRGLGEIGITGVPAAIANAIFNATGKRVRDLPITPDKLLL